MPGLYLVAPLLLLGKLVGEPLPLPPAPADEAGAAVATPWDPLVVEGCEEQLAEAGVERATFLKRQRVKTLRPRRITRPVVMEIPEMSCYVPQALHYLRGPGDIKYSGYVMVNCRMALALARFETIVQEEAARVFGPKRRVSWVKQLGTTNCRRLRLYPWVQSQHSFGNAIDIAELYVRGWGTVKVSRHWNPRWPSHEKPSEFLRAVARRLRDEGVFVNVLTPDYDAGHTNHFHLDLAPPLGRLAGPSRALH